MNSETYNRLASSGHGSVNLLVTVSVQCLGLFL